MIWYHNLVNGDSNSKLFMAIPSIKGRPSFDYTWALSWRLIKTKGVWIVPIKHISRHRLIGIISTYGTATEQAANNDNWRKQVKLIKDGLANNTLKLYWNRFSCSRESGHLMTWSRIIFNLFSYSTFPGKVKMDWLLFYKLNWRKLKEQSAVHSTQT